MGLFQKGNPGGGRKKLPPEINKARTESMVKTLNAIIEIREMTPKMVEKIDQKELPLYKRIILHSYIKNDAEYWENRLLGKPLESIDIVAQVDENISTNQIPEEELDEMSRIRLEAKGYKIVPPAREEK
jgi:hypothetical protein